MSFRLMLSKAGWKSGSLSLSYSSCYHQIWKDLEVKKNMILNSRISLFNEEAKKKKKGSTDHDFD